MVKNPRLNVQHVILLPLGVVIDTVYELCAYSGLQTTTKTVSIMKH